MTSTRAALPRFLAVAGALALGALAALVIPSAASAHHPIVTGSTACDAATGTWLVTWTVENSERDLAGKIIAVESTPADHPVTNIVVDAALPPRGQTPLSGVQTLPNTATGATLRVTAFWQRPGYTITKDDSASVKFKGTCEIPATAKPSATFASHCDGTVTTTLINGSDATKDASFKVTGENGFVKATDVAPGSSDSISVPAADAAKITVTAGRSTVATGGFQDPQDCATPQVTQSETCDGFAITVSNPDGGRSTSVTLTPSSGDEVKFTLAPGEEKETSFAASDGLTVKLVATGLDDTTLSWTKPDSCEPELPVTGSSLTTVILAGAAFVVLGAAILFFFRRRRGAHATF